MQQLNEGVIFFLPLPEQPLPNLPVFNYSRTDTDESQTVFLKNPNKRLKQESNATNGSDTKDQPVSNNSVTSNIFQANLMPFTSLTIEQNRPMDTESWLKLFTADINPTKSKQNCVHSSMIAMQAIKTGTPSQTFAPDHIPDFPVTTVGDNELGKIYSVCFEDLQFISQERPHTNYVEIILLENKVPIVNEFINLDAVSVSLPSCPVKDLTKRLSGLQRSENNTLAGYIYYTYKGIDPQIRGGHLAIFYVDESDTVFYVDAQQNLVSRTPPKKVYVQLIQENVFYLPSKCPTKTFESLFRKSIKQDPPSPV